MSIKFSSRALAAISALSATAAFAAGNSPTPTPIALTLAQYVQNFDTLSAGAPNGNSVTAALDLAGWQIAESGSGNAADGQYLTGNGSNNAGNIYSFGATGSTDRALGSLTSGPVSPNYIGAYFTNSTGTTITSLAISYFGEQWRRGTAANEALSFSYYLGTPATLDSTGWVNVTALDFLSPQGTAAGAVDGNSVRSSVASTILGLSIASGSSFAIRWTDSQTSPGTNDGLAIDDFAITANAATAVPEIGTWAMMTIGFGALGAALRRRRKPAFA